MDLADTLVDDFDPVDFLYRVAEHCTSLLDIGDAGVMLAPQGGPLRLVAATSERVRMVELFELDAAQGPCRSAYLEGHAVEHDLTVEGLWPDFTARAHQDGYLSVYAVPVQLRKETIGVLNLFRRIPEPLGEADQQLARALADATAVSLLQQTTLDHHRTLGMQLQQALSTRSIIEQAKGFLTARQHIDPDTAFQRLRTYARHHRRRIADVAGDIVSSTLTVPDTPAVPPGRKQQPPTA
ncbi:transcriptional regulator [Streptomyces spiroverticillatus]|uniref:Transcriptional regulator n=1 Tax=Streptomyces finlayi TaxID=67296 RepID=A0A919CE47_9ACTN|nr:transcriptional regulator [Streptomyces spiroverticillatus]GHD13437.1 transcriptional regulator [Streptomyces finlayi]